MGKNNKEADYGIYDPKICKTIADHLEQYISDIIELTIIDGQKVEEVEHSIKVVKKACKNLRKGRPDKVFESEEKYLEVLGSGGFY